MMVKKLLLIFFCFNFLNAFESYKADQAYEKKDYDKAKKIYSEVLEKDPTNFAALYNLGKVAYKQNDFEAAQKAFTGASLSGDKNISEKAYFNLGDSNIKLNKLDEALSAFESVLKINPENNKAKERIDLIKKLLEQQRQEQQEKDKQEKEKQEQEKKDKEQNQDQKSQQDKDKEKQEQKQKEDKDQKEKSEKDLSDKKKQNQKEQDSKKDSGSKESAQQDKGKQDKPDKSHQEGKEDSKDKDKSKTQHGDKESKEAGKQKSDNAKPDQGQKDEKQDLKHETSPEAAKRDDDKTKEEHKADKKKIQLPTKKGEAQALKNLDETSKMVLQAIEKNDADMRAMLVSANVGQGVESDEKNW